MPGGLDRTEATRLVNAMLGTAAAVATVLPVQARLCTSASTPTNTANGTEVSGGGYARQNFVTSSSSPTPAATNGATSNASTITFTNLPAATIAFIELWDSSSTPLRKMWGPLGTARTTVAGDSLVFSANQIVCSIGQ